MSPVPGRVPPPRVGYGVLIFAPPPGGGGATQGGQETDATNEPQDAPTKLQELILLIFIDQTGLETEPFGPKGFQPQGRGEDAANEPQDAPTRLQELISLSFIDQTGALQAKGLQPQGGRRGCSQ